MQLEEKDKPSKPCAILSIGALRNERGFIFGLRIANCARRIRSSTLDLSLIGSPNGSCLVLSRTLPWSSTVKRRETWHDHSLPEDDKVHSSCTFRSRGEE